MAESNTRVGVSARHGGVVFNIIIAIVLVGIGIALLLPPLSTPREARDRSSCKYNLKQIGLALHNYHDEYGVFPPAYTVDADGNRLHSWRTLLLPFLEQESLYNSIDLTKPWDDPANAEAAGGMVESYLCPASDCPTNCTTYVAVVGSDGIWQPGLSRSMAKISDPTSETLLVVEVHSDRAVPWMCPYDAEFSMFLEAGSKTRLPHEGGRQAVLADGSVRYIAADHPAEFWRALVSANGADSDVLARHDW